jgi:hypothetical protein
MQGCRSDQKAGQIDQRIARRLGRMGVAVAKGKTRNCHKASSVVMS